MAASLLLLLDDIASVLDDVSLLTKVAAKKTAGVLGDDLALNAQQVAGVKAERELPVVWAVARARFVNKAILVPAALAIGSFAALGRHAAADARRRLPLLRGRREAGAQVPAPVRSTTPTSHGTGSPSPTNASTWSPPKRTRSRARCAPTSSCRPRSSSSRSGTVAGQPFGTQLTVLAGIALLMTVGVYGLVAGIVKLDDVGPVPEPARRRRACRRSAAASCARRRG